MSNQKCLSSLKAEFERIERNHPQALLQTAARVVLGPSVVRVFNKGTKDVLQNFLAKIHVSEIVDLANPDEYRDWFENHLDTLAKEIKRLNPENSRITPGYKWGHAAKVLNLYIREIVLNSRYFTDEIMNKVSFWLFAPIDSIVINRLCKLGHPPHFRTLKEIDTPEKFSNVQKLLGDTARLVNVPRVWFDDNWGDRQ